jgi:hypothetical protein
MGINEKRNDARRLLDPMKLKHRNSVALNTGNTLAHELKKAEIAYKLIKLGYEVYTEAIFANNKGRSDIFVTDNCSIYEILHSEKEEDAILKTNKYPIPRERIYFIHTCDGQNCISPQEEV